MMYSRFRASSAKQKLSTSSHGNQSLFSSLHSAVVSGLPREPCEWRRSYGRPPRLVQLEGSFVPYDPDILPDEDDKTLVSRPYFHIFWTDCDVDGYKQTVRDEISEWQAALKGKNNTDWMIVVVIHDESKVKAKILPRSSVIDKIRNDFCNKQPERGIVLTEPLKQELKSLESWNQFFQKLRVLLLQAFNHHLTKYEENMRAVREKRNEPGWNYFDYFAIQEELAFMMEMLGLKEDALIQYDELEAMFDQFIENYASGEVVQWLNPLLQRCSSWTGMSLAKPLDLELHDRVKRSLTSLLEFRNYLFCRQSALCFAMGHAWQVAERALDFLHNTVIQLQSLQMELPKGATECWVVLSALEVLTACQKHENGQVDKCALFTAHLWDHVHNKLKELGVMFSLFPGTKPSSEQLSNLVDLMAGLVVSSYNDSAAEVRSLTKLRETLSSSDNFKKHYLEICELAMGTYKHIGRFRSSRKIGRELAQFYMKIGEPEKAEQFLVDSVKMYYQEGWPVLAHGTLRELALCQRQMNDMKNATAICSCLLPLDSPGRYVETACQVACSGFLSDADCSHHFQEVISVLDKCGNVVMGGEGIIELQQMKLQQKITKVDDEVSMEIKLFSYFPKPITCNCVQVALSPVLGVDDLQMNQKFDKVSVPTSCKHQQDPLTVDIENKKLNRAVRSRQAFPDRISTHAMYERRQGRVIVAGLACDNAHELLKRTDSTPNGVIEAELVRKGDYSQSLNSSDFKLQPGMNVLVLTMKGCVEGVFTPCQMCLRIQELEILQSLSNTGLYLQVACFRPTITIMPKYIGEFLAGIEQEATLSLSFGSQSLHTATPATLHSTLPVTFHTSQESSSFTLQPQDPYTCIDLDVRLFCPLTNLPSSSLTAEVECIVDEWPSPMQQEVTFLYPLQASNRIYTSHHQKYVQLTLKGNSDAELVITTPDLSAPQASFLFLNPGVNWLLSRRQSVSLVWEILPSDSKVESEVQATFTCNFTCDLDLGKQLRSFTYQCSLSHFQTWFILDYNLSVDNSATRTGADFTSSKCSSCHAGQTQILHLTVKPFNTLCSSWRPQYLAYKVIPEPSTWALSGKTIGVFSMTDQPYSTQLKVVPLAAGFRHLPKIQLYRYTGQTILSEDNEVWIRTEEAEKTLSPGHKTQNEFSEGDLEELGNGHVFNASLAKQIHVFPTATTSDVEVTTV